MIDLYAIAVIPQVYACNVPAASQLEAAFYKGYDRTTSITDELIENMVTVLRCQRVTCADLKFTDNADVELQNLVKRLFVNLDYYKDTSSFPPLAGYTTATDVQEEARLGLDAAEIALFVWMGSTKPAMDVNQLGSNA